MYSIEFINKHKSVLNKLSIPETCIGNCEELINNVLSQKSLILSEDSNIQSAVVESLTSKYLRYRDKKVRNQFREFCLSIGINTSVELEEKAIEIPKAYMQEIKKINLSHNERLNLIKLMRYCDWNYSEQYADRLSQSDHKMIRQRNKASSILNKLTPECLQLIYDESPESLKSVIVKYIN